MRNPSRLLSVAMASLALIISHAEEEAPHRSPQPRPGTLVSWAGAAGSGGGGGILCVIPPNLFNVESATVGRSHAFGVHYDGTVSSWGFGVKTNFPSGLTNVARVSTSESHTAALLKDGSVITWTGSASSPAPSTIRLRSELPPIRQVDAADGFTVGLAEDGKVFMWPGLVPREATNVVAIAAAASHALALRGDGKVIAWGGNNAGQAAVPPWLKDVVLIDAARDLSAALTADGMLHVWGRSVVPWPSPSFYVGTDFVDLAATRWGVALLSKDGAVMTYGHAPLPALKGAASIEGGEDTIVAVVPQGLTEPIITRFRLGGHYQKLPGESLRFFSNASGTGELRYQWFKDGAPLAGQTSTNFSLAGLEPKDAGTYVLQVSDLNGSVSSKPAIIEMVESRFLNHNLYWKGLRLEFGVAPGKPFRVQSSSDFENWSDYAGYLPSDPGRYFLEDPEANVGRKFYRIVVD